MIHGFTERWASLHDTCVDFVFTVKNLITGYVNISTKFRISPPNELVAFKYNISVDVWCTYWVIKIAGSGKRTWLCSSVRTGSHALSHVPSWFWPVVSTLWRFVFRLESSCSIYSWIIYVCIYICGNVSEENLVSRNRVTMHSWKCYTLLTNLSGQPSLLNSFQIRKQNILICMHYFFRSIN